ncbi:MAG: tetratricopeptide repeat protein [Chitinophagales bacterium]
MNFTLPRRILLILFLAPLWALAQTRGAGVNNESAVTTTSGKTYALVVGISDYKELPHLKYADTDAKTFAAYLKTISGTDTNNIKLLTNTDANRVNLISQLMSIKKSVGRGDKVYIYFAGHGDIETEISNGGILLLYDSYKENYYMNPNGFLHESDLKNIIAQISKSETQVFLITDACHSGSLSGGADGGNKSLLALKQEWGNESKIFSCQANEYSLEGQQWGNGRGLFSYHLVEALTGLADDDNDGKISLFELQTYLQRYVREQAKPNKQTPFITGNLDNIIANVNASLLAKLKESKANNYPLFAMADGRGTTPVAGFDAATYSNFQAAIKESRLVEPDKNNAAWFYSQLTAKTKNEAAKDELTRTFTSALLNRSTEIINPLLTGDVTYTSSSKIALAVKEMSKAMELLGPEHYLSANFKARKLFLEAVQLTLNKDDEKNPSNVSNALKKLQESIALEPYAYYAYYQSGYLYNLQKKSAQAIESYNKYLSFLPKDPEALNNVGVAYYNQGDYTKAIEYYNKSVALKPSSRAYTNTGLAYLKSNDAVKANENFEKAIATGKDNLLSTYFLVGKSYYDNNSADKAAAYFTKAIAINANHAPTLYYMGLAAYSKKDSTKALDYFSKAIASDPRYAEPYQKRADIYSAKKQFDKAAKDYDMAIMLNPKLWECYQQLGNAYIQLKQYDKAIDALENAVMTDRKLGKTLYLTLGNLYRDNLKSYERANGYYQKYIELNPMDGKGHAEAGMNFIYLKNFTAAEQSLQRASTLSPSDPTVNSYRDALNAAKSK